MTEPTIHSFLEEFQKVLRSAKTEEERDQLLRELAKTIPPAVVDAGIRIGLIQRVHQDLSPESFEAYFQVMNGFELAPHLKRQCRRIFQAHEEGKGYVLRAARGFRKTTTWGVWFLTYIIGKFPILTHVVVSANDDSAEKITQAVAAIIEHNPDWKDVFPNVVVDKDRGWGVGGFNVKDTDVSYEEWTKKRGGKIDPTLVGGGYKSTRINGKHPSGFLYIDDLHDLNNSASDTERAGVVKMLTAVILKTVIREKDKLKTWVFGIGVPWAEDDGLEIMANSGQYIVDTLPAMIRAQEGDEGAVFIDGRNRSTGVVFDDIVGYWILQYPEIIGVESIIAERSLSKFEFWQMMMMDIKTAKTAGLRYYSYKHEDIDPTWLHSGGCDFATLGETKIVVDKGRDKFSIAYGAKTPRNQMVVVDGILEQCTQAQAESHMTASEKKFKNWRPGIFEGDGAGEQFWLSFISRNRGARWMMKKTGGTAKRYRQEREMGPWLENATVLISDAQTPYLNALRKALEDFPDGNNDVRDGLYWLCRAFPETLVLPYEEEHELPQAVQNKNVYHLDSIWSKM